MKIPLLDFTESPEFQDHVKKKTWRNQVVLKPVLAEIAGKLCNKLVDMSKGSIIENISHKFSRKLITSKLSFSQFQIKEREWLIKTCFEIEEEKKLELEVDRSRWWKKRKSDTVFESSSIEEDDSVWAPEEDQSKQEAEEVAKEVGSMRWVKNQEIPDS